jgi:hypothetical protein
MSILLRLLLALSGLIELGFGVSFFVVGSRHPFVVWMLERGGASGALGPVLDSVALFLGLACLLAAALHALALRWHMAERDEAYTIVNVYGVFAVLSGIALFMTFSRASALSNGQAPAAWLPLVVDSVRGALLLAIGNVERLSPQTLRKLSLPESAPRSHQVVEETRRDRHYDRRPNGYRRRGSRFRGREGGSPDRAAREGAPRRPETSPSRATSAGDSGPAERDRDHRPRRRGRRGSRGRRSGSPAAQGASPEPGSEPSPRAERQDRAESAIEGERASRRDSGGRPSRSHAGARERRPRGEGGQRREEHPRTERPARAEPPRDRAPEDLPIERGGVRVVTPSAIEAGRRRKRGRYSISGALFRPREKRIHRPLGGGEAAREWARPAAGAAGAGPASAATEGPLEPPIATPIGERATQDEPHPERATQREPNRNRAGEADADAREDVRENVRPPLRDDDDAGEDDSTA